MAWLGDLGSALLGALYANPIPTALVGLTALGMFVVVARRRAWDRAARRHPRRTAAILALLAGATLPLAWYLASPLVLSASIDEPAPSISAPIARASTPPAERPAPSVVPSGASASPSASPSATPPATSAPGATLVERTGTFHGSDDFHFGRGTARLIEVGRGSFVVRLEDFAVRNGPDLYVYVSPSSDGFARGAIELGRLKADTGNQNYPVPAGALDDPTRAASVVVWCKQFSHLFATAPLGR
jgi:hypothetical protein